MLARQQRCCAPQLAPAPHAARARLRVLRPQRRRGQVAARASAADGASGEFEVEYLVDMECPLRRSEVDALKRLDRNRRIRFVDISARGYAPEAHGGVTYEDAMGAPAARLRNGTLLRSAEVYGALYGAVGLGAVWQATRLPGVRPAVDAVFDFWSAARLPLTGRGDLDQVLARREADKRE